MNQPTSISLAESGDSLLPLDGLDSERLRQQMGDLSETLEGGQNPKIHSLSWFERDPADCESLSKSFLGRVADGIPNRSHRLKGLGNAIVPQVAYEILKAIRST